MYDSFRKSHGNPVRFHTSNAASGVEHLDHLLVWTDKIGIDNEYAMYID